MTIRFASIKPALLAAAILLGLAVECGKAQAAPAETAIFAGGCFWCVEADFERVRGVGDAVSGFTGGRTANPEYPAKGTGHFEAVRIPFDPEVVSYRQLVDMFFRSIDPLDAGGQFCDRGPSYRSAIFVLDAAQRREAEAAKAAAEQALGQRMSNRSEWACRRPQGSGRQRLRRPFPATASRISRPSAGQVRQGCSQARTDAETDSGIEPGCSAPRPRSSRLRTRNRPLFRQAPRAQDASFRIVRTPDSRRSRS
jgi:methionine-S-sulfoxide reductase